MNATEDWLTVRQTADLLKIPLTRCYMLINAGLLPGAVRVGKRSIRVNRATLERALMEEHRVVGGE